MGQMKDGPAYAIDAMSLYQMVSDPNFFIAVPAFFFLKPVADAVVKKIVDSVVSPPKGSCVGCNNIRQQMLPVAEAFVAHIRQMKQVDEKLLEPIGLYIASRLRYRPRPIIVYYKESDGQRNDVRF